ncbi:MAG: DEAD/DEAH box helicase [Nanoarchaeota archaeon]
MKISDLKLPEPFRQQYGKFDKLTPIQEKSVDAGLLEGRSLLACAPTASGKTLVATMAIYNIVGKGKAIYLVPLKALGSEKFKEYLKSFQGSPYKVGLSTGDIDSESDYLSNYDILILTTEKLDSLLRHRTPWLSEVKVVIVDEIHLLNDSSRGPTLEIILTLLKNLIKPQIIGLSATIGNPKELADWLGATLVIDDWRPVELKKGIFCNGEVEYY